MSAQYEAFRALHAGTFVMPNPWDGMSALLMKRHGFAAIASSSSSIAIAYAMGLPDARAAVSRQAAIANAALLGQVSGLPVNGDLEDGFGPSPEDCVATVEAAIAAGLAGLGIEDTTANPAAPIHGFEQAVARVKAAAKAAKGRILLTGRCDNFLFGRPDLDDTIRRLVAFAEVGADVVYAPGLPDMAAIEAVVRAVAPLPVNVVVGPRSGLVPVEALAAAGVKRISLGGALYRHCMGALAEAADQLRAGELGFLAGAPTSASLNQLLPST